jgi:hypothetical protein
MNWTREVLAAYRSRMGWPALTAEQGDQVIGILNDVQEKLGRIALPPTGEPAVVFVAREGAGS